MFWRPYEGGPREGERPPDRKKSPPARSSQLSGDGDCDLVGKMVVAGNGWRSVRLQQRPSASPARPESQPHGRSGGRSVGLKQFMGIYCSCLVLELAWRRRRRKEKRRRGERAITAAPSSELASGALRRRRRERERELWCILEGAATKRAIAVQQQCVFSPSPLSSEAIKKKPNRRVHLHFP